ncbi:hypothetical protein [Halalkalibacter hemicellulosilyticus]|uniref:Uncharacterized protein n=1 Tax=Halalkalibacter hemicellulosilyticusJCM 9152 TaxID=1236971 RepID=W4QH20_9BACI|nr:hypothetical protein [Halalkalibacter hemicellulosilyticus]GAE31222.1 hypothetical protein JCM9152_2677 [Halalkalibacter hemicellulosilyticusJCM 9152]
MADQQPPERDFFSDLMFGRPQQQTTDEERVEPDESENIDKQETQQQTNYQSSPNQLDAIFTLAQSLAPLFSFVQDWLSKRNNGDKNETKKEK